LAESWLICKSAPDTNGIVTLTAQEISIKMHELEMEFQPVLKRRFHQAIATSTPSQTAISNALSQLKGEVLPLDQLDINQ
jgi:hypothetical protein